LNFITSLSDSAKTTYFFQRFSDYQQLQFECSVLVAVVWLAMLMPRPVGEARCKVLVFSAWAILSILGQSMEITGGTVDLTGPLCEVELGSSGKQRKLG
jgi:hypothetical protein